MPPRVSVIIPSYNHSRYIAQAIRSVLDQDVDDLELVIVDDGSTDESVAVIRSVFEQYPDRNTQLIEQENHGAHHAIMRGIEASSSPVLSILNSDDYYLPGRFSAMLPEVEAHECALAFSKLELIDDQSKPLANDSAWVKWYNESLEYINTNPTLGFAFLEANFTVTSGNFVFTRSLYEKLGGFSEHKFVHDWDFLIRSLWHTEPIMIDQELMAYRTHDSNTTELVRSLLEKECDEVIERYRDMCECLGTPANTLAPHPKHWGVYFNRFVSNRKAFWKPNEKTHAIGSLTKHSLSI
ncbi:hypothetical protein COB72_05440 [bacterium]|nr:MAG: hypothetical protein COB72_05440 [bacterium]